MSEIENVAVRRLPWQQGPWQSVRNWRQQQRVPHGVLLKGPAGLGKLQFARAVAQAVQCRASDSLDGACGECDRCHLLAAGSQPDFHQLQPEQDKSVISIDQVRALCRQLSLTSQHGGTKVAIIAPAEAMSRSAANSLLKTLEEPPGDSLLLLLANAPAQLPATIRSRCQEIAFRPVHDEAAEQWLAGQAPEVSDPALLLSLANGAPLLARDLVQGEGLQNREKIISGLRDLLGAAANPVKTAEAWYKLGLADTVHWMWMLVEDILRLKQDANLQLARNRDIASLLQPLAERLDYQVLFQLLDWCLEAQRVLQGHINLNQQLMLEDLTITWRNASR